jgi:hypothetical protein
VYLRVKKEMCLRVKKEILLRVKKLTAQLPLLREVDGYENPSVGILLRLVYELSE